MSNGDKLLLLKAKSGDIEAFELLIEKYQKKIFNIALRMTNNHDDASELAQEVLLKIYRSLHTFKEQALFSTWIYRVTTNVCLDELRKRKIKNIVYINDQAANFDKEIDIEDKGYSPHQIAEKNELKGILNKAIASLTEEQRIVVILRDIKGMSYEEIGEIVGCPEGTVKSRINRARQSLREILKNDRELFLDNYV